MTVKTTLQGLSMVALLALIPPFVWHLKTKNIPALTLLVWLFLFNLKTFVDATIWSKDIVGLITGWDGKGWCDLMIYIDIGAYVAVPCCVCRIALQLTYIIKAENILPDVNDWRYIVKDLILVNFLPFLCMLMSYFIQINRYGLTTYNGCQPFLSTTWVALVLYTVWPFLASILGTILSLRLLFIFYKKRKDAKDILYCTDSGFTLSRFSRFILFCLLIILIMGPVSIYNFINTCQKLTGKYSYKKIHENGSWWIIPKLFTSKPFYSVWIYMAMAYSSFFIFGTSTDALNMYLTVLKKIGFKKIIENWEERKQEKRQQQINDMFQAQFLSSNKTDSSLTSKAETPIEVNGQSSDWTETPNYSIYQGTDVEFIISKNDTDSAEHGVANNDFDSFEIDYKGVPNSSFSYVHPNSTSNDNTDQVHNSPLKSNSVINENQLFALLKKHKKQKTTAHNKTQNKQDKDEMFFHYQIQHKKG